MEVENIILIDQSYFLENSEEQSPEEKAKDFIKSFLEAKESSYEYAMLPFDKKVETISEFLFESLQKSNSSGEMPTSRDLDKFIQGKLKPEQPEILPEKSADEWMQELMNQIDQDEKEVSGPGESGSGEESEEGPEEGQGTSQPEGRNESGNREIQDGENVTIRRERGTGFNRFF